MLKVTSLPDTLPAPPPEQLKWLTTQGVSWASLATPEVIRSAKGIRAPDGYFEPGNGSIWLGFPEVEDTIFWQPRTGELATWTGRSFALGEAVISNPGTYSMDGRLNLFPDPLDWLRAGRDGIVVRDWSRAFDQLRDVPRIAVHGHLLKTYQQHMRPRHMPQVFVITQRRCAA